MNYYNEIDTFAAAWLRELIKANLVAKGEVDERDIRDIKPNELRGYTQCHFFAGIGVWSYALRNAGWPDDRPVWTGSCPCQPFSAAGKRKGVADERHLWPAFFHLIQECKPVAIFGEQVKAAIKQGWLDLVQNDLEGIGYTLGAVPFPACSVGAPHIRQRVYFVAESERRTAERQRLNLAGTPSSAESRTQERQWIRADAGDGDPTGVGQADAKCNEEYEKQQGPEMHERRWSADSFSGRSVVGGVAQGDTAGFRQPGRGQCDGSTPRLHPAIGSDEGIKTEEPRFTGGFWRDAEWINCLDGRQRPVEPGTFPLAHGATNRMGRLRGYGNAIVAPQAQAFIESYLEVEQEKNDEYVE